MTQEDQDAVIGRVVRERRDLQTRLAALEAEANRLGNMFSHLGMMLQQSPDIIVFEGHPAPAELRGDAELFKPVEINAETIIKLIDDIHGTQRALNTAERQAQQFGL